MKLYEYQGAELFSEYGITVPKHIVLEKLSDIKKKSSQEFFNKMQRGVSEFVVKAQILSGKRGKHGGVVYASSATLEKTCKELLKKKINNLPVQKLMIAHKEKIKEEYYLAITINRLLKKYTLLFSRQGGIDIEELAEKSPNKILHFSFFALTHKDLLSFLNKTKIHTSVQKRLAQIIKKLFKLMIEKDATLVEINPLLLTIKDNLIAADSKVTIDNNALYRQAFEKNETTKTKLEQKAANKGLQYVELDGNIGVIGNGAGLVMGTLDVLSYFKGKPASFLDVGGGSGEQAMRNALAITMQKNIKGLFINIFAGITHCDNIAKALVTYKKKHKVTIPVVVRMIGTNEKKGRKILEENGIHAMTNMETAAKKMISLTRE